MQYVHVNQLLGVEVLEVHQFGADELGDGRDELRVFCFCFFWWGG